MDKILLYDFILLILLPAWLLVGLGDWYCHRKSHIEHTAGARESVLHLMLSFEAAVGVLSGLFFEINALILCVIIVAFIVHEITTSIDFRVADPERRLTPTEMRVHDYLTAIPFAAVCLVLMTHTGQLLAIVGLGNEEPDWTVRWKVEPLPVGYLVGWNLAAVLLNIGPYSEELIRCLRAARKIPSDLPSAWKASGNTRR